MRLVTCSVLFLGVGTPLTQATSLEPKEASETVTIQADNQVGGSCGGNLIKFDRQVVKSGGHCRAFHSSSAKGACGDEFRLDSFWRSRAR
jgi:hypothetical protein